MSKIEQLRATIKNAYGISDEDVTNILRMVSEIVAEQMPQPAPAPTIPPNVATQEYVRAYVDGAIHQLRLSVAGTVNDGMERMLATITDEMDKARTAMHD